MHEHASRIIDLYRRHAEAWTRARGNRLIETAWLDRFCALLPENSSVLDIGCGSGEPMARYLIECGSEVTFVDSAPEMIALCRRNFPGGTFHIADMRSLSLNRHFNGILAWDSFFHLCPDDQHRMFPIFRAHAAPHAALMFTSGPARGRAIGTLEGEPLYHASLDPDEYRALLDENGFHMIAHQAEDPHCGGHTVWLAQLTA
jgi:SAM-dependent methyltransferase